MCDITKIQHVMHTLHAPPPSQEVPGALIQPGNPNNHPNFYTTLLISEPGVTRTVPPPLGGYSGTNRDRCSIRYLGYIPYSTSDLYQKWTGSQCSSLLIKGVYYVKFFSLKFGSCILCMLANSHSGGGGPHHQLLPPTTNQLTGKGILWGERRRPRPHGQHCIGSDIIRPATSGWWSRY